MGQKPDGLIPVKNWTCAERAFISIPGTVKRVLGLEQIHTQPFVNDVFSHIKSGSKVNFPENNVSKCGNILASAEDRAAAIKAAEAAARSVLIHLDPADKSTEEFLGIDSHGEEIGFPPNAFLISEQIKEALYKLPEDTKQQLRLPQEDAVSVPSPSAEKRFLHVKKFELIPFPEFTSSGLTDYMDRTIKENLEAVCRLTGLTLSEAGENADNKIILGRPFWAAFIRGAYQGAVYYIENLNTE
jgi:hypothetical protein